MFGNCCFTRSVRCLGTPTSILGLNGHGRQPMGKRRRLLNACRRQKKKVRWFQPTSACEITLLRYARVPYNPIGEYAAVGADSYILRLTPLGRMPDTQNTCSHCWCSILYICTWYKNVRESAQLQRKTSVNSKGVLLLTMSVGYGSS